MSKKENTEVNIKDSWLNKLKNVKHIDIVIIIVFVSILLMIYFSDSIFTTIAKTTDTQAFTSYFSYTKDLENRLSEVLNKISGAGKISVMITLDGSPELIIAYNTEEKNNTDGSVTTKKEPIIITIDGKSNPLILSEKLPAVKGVVIVAQGANDVSVRLNILNATTKLLNISANAVEIFAGN